MHNKSNIIISIFCVKNNLVAVSESAVDNQCPACINMFSLHLNQQSFVHTAAATRWVPCRRTNLFMVFTSNFSQCLSTPQHC